MNYFLHNYVTTISKQFLPISIGAFRRTLVIHIFDDFKLRFQENGGSSFQFYVSLVINQVYLNLLQTMTMWTFYSRLYCFSFIDPSFLGFFFWGGGLRNISFTYTFMVNKKSPRIINQVQLSHLVLVLILLLIWILENGKYMIV